MLVDVRIILKKLNEEFPNWEEVLKKDPELIENTNANIKEKIFELIVALKQKCKEENDLKEFWDLLDNNEVIEILQKQVNKSLLYYNIFKPIRIKCSHEQEFVKKFVDDVFCNYILRYDPKIIERYEICDSEDENVIKEIVKAFERLTEFYVERLLVKREVAKDFEEETGFPEMICKFYADLYEKYFEELKMNLILYSVREIRYLMGKERE